MNPVDEAPFRVVFGAFWALNIMVRSYFQVKAKAAEKSFSRSERRTKLLFRVLAFTFPLMLVYVFSTWFDFAHVPLPARARWSLGGGISIVYLVLFSWIHHTLGRNWSGLLEIHKDHTLITHGPYRYVRHPMYTSFFILGVGILLLSANWLIASVYLIAASSMYIDRVSSEEKMMIERFGDAYRDYMKRTGRLIPRLPV